MRNGQRPGYGEAGQVMLAWFAGKEDQTQEEQE